MTDWKSDKGRWTWCSLGKSVCMCSEQVVVEEKASAFLTAIPSDIVQDVVLGENRWPSGAEVSSVIVMCLVE